MLCLRGHGPARIVGKDRPQPEMNKQARIEAAQTKAMERVGKRAISLTVAVLRVKVMRECLQPIRERLAQEARGAAELRAEAFDKSMQLELVDAGRADSLYSAYFGLLYAVVERWHAWKFTDAEVDRLLTVGPVDELRKCRHAIFHADHYDQKDILVLAGTSDIMTWSEQLQHAFEAFFARWHADAARHIAEYVARHGT